MTFHGIRNRACCGLLLAAAALLQLAAQAPQDRSRLRVEVNLVNVIVSVTDVPSGPLIKGDT